MDEKKVLGMLMEGDVRYADVFSEETSYTQLQVESERIEKLERATDKGVCLRAVTPWKTFLASTNVDDGKRVEGLARDLARTAAGTPSAARDVTVTPVAASYPFEVTLDPRDVETERKVRLVRSVEAAARAMDRRVTQVRVTYRDTRQAVRIATSDAMLIEDTRTQVVMSLLMVGEDGGELQTAYEAIGGFSGFDFFTDERLERLVRVTARRLAGLLGASEAPRGPRTVVLACEAGGTMVHEAIGHGLEADLAMENLSCYKDLLGREMANPALTIVDDKTVPHGRGSYAFDDEGTPAEKTVVVEKGVLKSYLFDRFNALKYGMRSTANGRRESFRFKPIPRMSNTMILPGSDDPDAILASVDDGILVKKMGGGQVDTVRGDFVFEISEGYLIEKGRMGSMIRNATMMGNGPRVLRDIDMIGTDLGFGIGTCGKDGQGVPISDAQPTLRIQNIIVGGRGQ